MKTRSGEMVKINMLESMPDSPVKDPVFEIIGVISDAKNQGIREPPMPEMFVPYTITGAFYRSIMVRTSAPPLSLLNNVRREIWAVDPNIALNGTRSLEDFLKQFSYAEPRFSLVLMSVFASVGLALVALGVFSVIAYTVARQTHEIGIRMALGAGRADVVRMVLRSGIAVGRVGRGRGIAGEFRRDAGDRQSALGSVAARSVDAGRGGGRGGAGRSGGVLFPGAAGDESGSAGSASMRIDVMRIDVRC